MGLQQKTPASIPDRLVVVLESARYEKDPKTKLVISYNSRRLEKKANAKH